MHVDQCRNDLGFLAHALSLIAFLYFASLCVDLWFLAASPCLRVFVVNFGLLAAQKNTNGELALAIRAIDASFN
jgi:hypothetical protein